MLADGGAVSVRGVFWKLHSSDDSEDSRLSNFGIGL